MLEQREIDDIPVSIIEHVLQHTDLFTVCSAALASRSLRQASHVRSVACIDIANHFFPSGDPLC